MSEAFKCVYAAEADLYLVWSLLAELFDGATVAVGVLALLGDSDLVACRVER